MADKVAVKDTVTGKTIFMWECDAEEARRYDIEARYTIQAKHAIPAKTPSGRGWH